MTRNILSIGLELASDAVKETRFSSKTSLLDWDIVLFRPVIDEFISIYTDKFQGKPSLNDTDSFRLREACEHWRREIKQALNAGKTIIVFLSTPQECYIDSGKREHSGTGRNRQTTRFIDLYTNYHSLPIKLQMIAATGTTMKLTSVGSDILAPYWEQFSLVSSYKLLLPQDTEGVCLSTKHGDKPVGAILRDKNSSGSLILLPDIDFLPDDFLETDGSTWSSDAKQFAARMTCAVVALDRVLRASDETTPEPAWATDEMYALSSETALRTELLEADRQVEEAQKKKEDIQERLKDAGRLRALLFEKGKPLEKAIIQSLKLLGFAAIITLRKHRPMLESDGRAGEIEVTPAMIEAGVYAAKEYCLGEGLQELVGRVFIAMRTEELDAKSAGLLNEVA